MTPSSPDTRGDLIVMSPSDNGISRMIREYDRSPYTHIGIDVGDGTVVNCRTEARAMLEGEDGGVRVDRFDRITDRTCFRAPVIDVDRELAVRTALAWAEEDGKGALSAFSFPKMIQCAVAVSASRPGKFPAEAREAMLDAAFAAADAWRYDPATRGDRPHSFFCAEMVVVAYGAEVPVEYLEPPEVEPDLDHVRASFDVRRLARDLADSWGVGGRARTMTALGVAVAKHDPGFFRRALEAALDWAGTEHADTVAARAGSTALPAALVTPRMLLRCTDWVGPVDPDPVRG